MTTTKKSRPGISRLSRLSKPKMKAAMSSPVAQARNTTKLRPKNMRLKKTEVDRRRQVALDYFKQNPNATGEAFNKALTGGSLTGTKEPALNIKKVYDLRKEARTSLAAGEKPPTIPAAEFKSARRFGSQAVAVDGPPSLTEVAKGAIRSLLGEFSKMTDVQDVTVHRDGQVEVGRMQRTTSMVSM